MNLLPGERIEVIETTCPVLPDGRTRHYAVKEGGQWVCDACGQAVQQPGAQQRRSA